MLALFRQNSDHADLCLIIAVILLFVVGLISIINSRPAKYGWLQGVAWIATGFGFAALLFFTG